MVTASTTASTSHDCTAENKKASSHAGDTKTHQERGEKRRGKKNRGLCYKFLFPPRDRKNLRPDWTQLLAPLTSGGEGCGELIWRLRHLHPDLEIIDLIFIPLFLRETPGLKMEVAAEVCALHEGVG